MSSKRLRGLAALAALGASGGACTTFDSELAAPGYDIQVVASDIAFPDGLANGPDGTLLVTEEYRGGGVIRLDPASGYWTHIVRDLADPDNIVVIGDDLYVTEEDAQGRIVRIDGQGGVTTFASGLSGPEGLDLGPDGNLYVAEHAPSGHVYGFSMDGQRWAVAPIVQGEGLRCLPDGSLVVAETSHGRVVRIGPDGERRRITDQPMELPDGVTYDPTRDRILVTEDATPGRLLAIDVATGEMTEIATGMNKPQTMLVDPDGSILVAEQGESRIVRLTPEALAQEGQLR